MSSKRKEMGIEISHKIIKFVSEEAQEQFRNIESLPFIYERGFKIEVRAWTIEYANQIEALKWGSLCHPRSEAILPWVYEFYANAKFEEGTKAFVRGKYVDFCSTAINDYFDLENHEPDDFSTSQTIVSADEMASFICCTSEPEWANRSKHTLRASCLSREAKVWLLFINASIMPTKHLNNLSLGKVALIFSILRRDKINVGKLISTNIRSKAHENKARQLWFPTLITELCRVAGVLPKEGELVTKVGHHITDTVISKNIKVADEISPQKEKKGKPSSSMPPPTTQSTDTPSTSVLTQADKEFIMENLEYLKSYQRFQHVYFESRLDLLHQNQLLLMKKANIPVKAVGHRFQRQFDVDGYLLDADGTRADPTGTDEEKSASSNDSEEELYHGE